MLYDLTEITQLINQGSLPSLMVSTRGQSYFPADLHSEAHTYVSPSTEPHCPPPRQQLCLVLELASCLGYLASIYFQCASQNVHLGSSLGRDHRVTPFVYVFHAARPPRAGVCRKLDQAGAGMGELSLQMYLEI